MGGLVAVYNYLGFRLEGPGFGLPVIAASLIFAAYGAGTVSSRLVGRGVPRFGRRPVLITGLLTMITGTLLTLSAWLPGVITGLVILTAGAFVVHAVASAWVGHHAHVGRAQATALYNVSLYTGSAVIGWVALNRSTFCRRTFAVGGNPEAARLAGIDVRRHTVALYAISGLCCGIAAVMIVARTTTGSSTHGGLYELDAIAAVVIGGTLLSGGRGTIVGTVLGVLIFTVLSNVFTQNNLSSSAQSVAKGLIIVVAVLLQQRLARRSNTGT